MQNNKNRIWIFPYDASGYDVDGAFSGQSFIYWHQGQPNYKVGDILYMYAILPEQRITHKAEVVEVDVIYDPTMDNDSLYVLKEGFGTIPGEKCIKIMPLAVNKGILANYQFLQNIGIGNFRSPNSLTREQIDEIERVNKYYDINFGGLSIGDLVSHKSFGEGTVIGFEDTYVIIGYADGNRKFKYPSAVNRGFLVKK